MPIRTVTKDLDTAGCEAAISRPDQLLAMISPVVGRLIEMCHPVHTNLSNRGQIAVPRGSVRKEEPTYGKLALFCNSMEARSAFGRNAVLKSVPPEELERDRIKACVVDTRETVRDSVLNGEVEPLLELLVGRLGAHGIDELLSVIYEDTCRLALGIPNDDSALDLVWNRLHQPQNFLRHPKRMSVFSLKHNRTLRYDRVTFQIIL